MQVTRQLAPQCVWTHPCTRNPCIDGASCVEEGYYYYKCLCDQSNCFKARVRGDNDPAIDAESASVVHVQDVVVREGNSIPLTSHNIAILIDYARLRIRDTAITFHVIQSPRNGELQVLTGEQLQRPSSTFTLADLKAGKITYVHDGSDTVSDSIGLELTLPLPPAAGGASAEGVGKSGEGTRRQYAFTIVVVVIPWNDPPLLVLPDDETLTVVENTQVKVTQRLLNATDQDDLSPFLEYMVQYQSGGDTGFFELTGPTGKRAGVTTFLQKDINEGRLVFVHRGKAKQNIRVQVSDI